MPHGPTNAPTHQELAQSECWTLCHFVACGLNLGHHPAMAHGSPGAKYVWAHIRLPVGPTLNAESRLQAIMDEYPQAYFHFWLIFWFVKSHLLRTQFQPRK